MPVRCRGGSRSSTELGLGCSPHAGRGDAPPKQDLGSPHAGPHEEASELPEHPAAVAAAGPCCPLVPRSTPWASTAPRCSPETPLVFSFPIPNSSFPPGLQIPWVQPPAPGAHFGCALPRPSHQRAAPQGLPAPQREGESPRGRRAAPGSRIHHPQGCRAKLVPIRASPAAHSELWVPGQPCPTPPMVPRGPGWGSPDRQQANLGLPGPSRGSGLVLAHQQHPKPPFQPPNQHRVAPPGAEPPPLRLRLPAPSASGSAGRTGGRGVTSGTGHTRTPRLPQPQPRPWSFRVGRSQPRVWGCLIPTSQWGSPQPRGQSWVPQSPRGGRALSPS